MPSTKRAELKTSKAIVRTTHYFTSTFCVLPFWLTT